MKPVRNTILLVEDEVEISEALTEVLGTQGYEVICARSGEQAWLKFCMKKESICAVLCDGNILPSDIDPVRLIELIKGFDYDGIVIPISSAPSWNKKMILAGADGPAIQKPINPAKLFETLPKPPILSH